MINLRNKSGIYCITNLVNGKKYFGQSVDLFHRFYKYSLGNFTNEHLERAVKKYGWDNFTIKPFIYCAEEYLNVMEKYFIKKYNTMNRDKGYNKKEGGDGGGRCSEEVGLKISNSLKELYKNMEHHMKGKTLTNETKDKISKSNKGISRKYCGKGMTGKKHSDETLLKMSSSHKKVISEKGISIIGINKNNDILFFRTCNDARYSGFTHAHDVVRGIRPQCKGYFFRIATEEEISFFTS